MGATEATGATKKQNRVAGLFVGVALFAVIFAMATSPAILNAQDGVRSAEDAADRQLAQRAAAAITSKDIALIENPRSQVEKNLIRERTKILFGSKPFPPTSDVKTNLVKVERENALREQERYRDTDFIFSATEISGAGISGPRHLLFVTIRHFENGNIDFGLAAAPVAGGNSFQSGHSRSGWFRWVFLGLAVLIPFFMLMMGILCFVQRPRFRILWFIFIFLGFFRMDFDWATGALRVLPLQVIFFGFHISHETLSIAWPLGAFLFYARWLSERFRRGNR